MGDKKKGKYSTGSDYLTGHIAAADLVRLLAMEVSPSLPVGSDERSALLTLGSECASVMGQLQHLSIWGYMTSDFVFDRQFALYKKWEKYPHGEKPDTWLVDKAQQEITHFHDVMFNNYLPRLFAADPIMHGALTEKLSEQLAYRAEIEQARANAENLRRADIAAAFALMVIGCATFRTPEASALGLLCLVLSVAVAAAVQPLARLPDLVGARLHNADSEESEPNHWREFVQSTALPRAYLAANDVAGAVAAILGDRFPGVQSARGQGFGALLKKLEAYEKNLHAQETFVPDIKDAPKTPDALVVPTRSKVGRSH